jgi:hypothetical protein
MYLALTLWKLPTIIASRDDPEGEARWRPLADKVLRLGFVAARAIQNRSKPKMRGAEVHFLRLPCGRSIACAVVGGAQIGAALDDTARRLAAG